MNTNIPSEERFAFSARARFFDTFPEAELDLPNENAHTISLAYGDADPALFPINDIVTAVHDMLQTRVDQTLNYAPPERALLELVQTRMSRHNVNLALSQIILTNGSMQLIALLPQILCDPGDAIIVEGPTFLGTVETFMNYGLRIETVPVRDDGMDLDALEATLAKLQHAGVPVKFIYTIPTFQNPTGTLMPLANRVRLLALAKAYNVLIVEDDAYCDLHFGNETPAKVIALDDYESVLYVGTFSKILAPGVRMAWACGPEAIIKRLQKYKSEGSNGPFMTRLVSQISADGWLDRHITVLNENYAHKCGVMLHAIKTHLPSDIRYVIPQGGFFVYIYLPDDLPTALLLPEAITRGVSFLPGTTCYANGQGTHEMRLAFSYQSAERIAHGIALLGDAMRAVRSGTA